ncbi:MAG TPA: hypothetical protein VFW17_06995 [Ktedonobacterales bacterium]|jgi:hypothetical protein|nr:hypothetical protein [Ktedonobacterales bacterium]
MSFEMAHGVSQAMLRTTEYISRAPADVMNLATQTSSGIGRSVS